MSVDIHKLIFCFKKTFSRLYLILLVILPGTFFQPGCANLRQTLENHLKAVYLWDYSYHVLADKAERQRFFQIAKEEGINLVYVKLSEDTLNLFDSGEVFRSFISQAKGMGISVHALIASADPSVFDNPETDKPYIMSILRYNMENPEYPIIGINWDNEPQYNLAPSYFNYMEAIKKYTYSGQTIVTQHLILSAYLESPYWLGPGFEQLYGEFDVICINSYGDTLEKVIEHADDGPDYCEKQGIKFTLGLETDEIDDSTLTVFDDGKETYDTLSNEIDTYFGSRYSHYGGQYLNHYEKAISWWHMIVSADTPHGEFKQGETLSPGVVLRRSDTYPDSPLGVKLVIADSESHTWSVSRIVVLGGTETRKVDFQWSVPASGLYHTEISVWDLDYGGHSSILLDNIGAQEIQTLTMEQLSAMPVKGKREPFIQLDNTIP